MGALVCKGRVKQYYNSWYYWWTDNDASTSPFLATESDLEMLHGQRSQPLLCIQCGDSRQHVCEACVGHGLLVEINDDPSINEHYLMTDCSKCKGLGKVRCKYC